MNCKEVQKHLLSLVTNDLPEDRRREAEDHLRNCPDCSRLADGFSRLWGMVEPRERIQPSPYFWTKLKQRIIEHEQGKNPVFGWIGGLTRLTRPAAAVAATLVCIFLGYSLGNFPQQVNGQTVSQVERGSIAGEEFTVSDYLDPLTGLPSGSIETTYLKMISEE